MLPSREIVWYCKCIYRWAFAFLAEVIHAAAIRQSLPGSLLWAGGLLVTHLVLKPHQPQESFALKLSCLSSGCWVFWTDEVVKCSAPLSRSVIIIIPGPRATFSLTADFVGVMSPLKSWQPAQAAPPPSPFPNLGFDVTCVDVESCVTASTCLRFNEDFFSPPHSAGMKGVR